MTPSVDDNSKYRCNDCGAIVDLSDSTGNIVGNLRRCPVCGSMNWDQIQVTRVCDFCATSHNVSWEFPCEDFRVPIAPGFPLQGFKGAWAACDTCKPLVEARDYEGLLDRAVEVDPQKKGHLAQKVVRQAHTGFFAHRTGPPVPYQEGEQ